METNNSQTMTALNEPPPSYECVVALDKVISRKRENLYTFKGCQHHSGHDRKDYFINGNETATPTIPQVSLDETNCDIQSPSSTASLCNCSCAINQTYSTNLCANCNNVIDNMNNNITCPLTATSNLAQENCPLLSDTNCPSKPKTETDLLNDQLNNNDYNGNSSDSTASPSTSTSANYTSCPRSLPGERKKCANDTEAEDKLNLDGNGNLRQLESMNLSTINRNGLIRLDMSQIIDQTGLPTYEAALQLKSSGYV